MLHFHQLTVKDGLPNNSIIALGQDKQGIIWIATPSGMCFYDGTQFNFLSTNGLPDKRVDRINCASDGTLWVQCYEQHNKVIRLDSLTRQFTTYDRAALTDAQWHQAVKPLNRTYKDPNSSITWYVEKRMLWQKDSASGQPAFSYTGQTAIESGLKDETIFCLLLDRNGILWAGTANNGLFFADTQQQHYRRLACTVNPLIRAVCMDNKGTLWFATSYQGLNALPKGQTQYEKISYPLTDSIEGRRIRPIIEDSRQRLWLGTFDGLYLRQGTDGYTFKRITFPDKLTHPIYALAEDGNRRLWIGTPRGLYRMTPDKSMQPELIDSTIVNIIDIYCGKDHCWVATEKGLFRKTINGLEAWSSDEAHSVITDATGHTWVGTDNGLCRISGGKLQPFASHADGHIVKDLLCWRDFLWCCYDQGICCINIYTGKSTKIHTLYNEYMEGASFLDTRTGTLYFGGNQGIDCIVADSLDQQLRRGISQLWLEEVKEALTAKDEEQVLTAWWQWLAMAVMVCGMSGVVIWAVWHRRRQKTTVYEKQHTDYQESPVSAVSPFVAKIEDYVNAHLSDTDLTAEQIAREMAMSRTRLFEQMKHETGKPVMEFVRDIRLEYAARRLEAGDSIAEITYACGFSDPSSFRRAFTNKYGVTPSQYKVEHRF